MPAKRKHDLFDFDPNKSDSEDESFDPSEARPARSRKKIKPARTKSSARKGTKYRGSDIDDDEEDDEDEELENSYDEEEEEDEEEEDLPVNASGRRMRNAAAKATAVTYKESSEDEEPIKSDSEADDKDELAPTPKKPSKIIKLRIPSSMKKVEPSPVTSATRRSTRARTVDSEDEFVELSNSGKHSKPARASESKSPEVTTRSLRATRGSRGSNKAPPSIIEEATQESSFQENAAAEEIAPDPTTEPAPEVEMENAEEKRAEEDAPIDVPMETVEPNEQPDEDDDDDDVPVTRRTRAARGSLSGLAAEVASVEPAGKGATGRRLTRRSQARKSAQEPSSDFEPDNDSGDNASEANSQAGKPDESPSPASRGRRSTRNRRSKRGSRNSDESGDDAELDKDELAEEAFDLETESRSRPRRRRQRTPDHTERLPSKRVRNEVNYRLAGLNEVPMEVEEEVNLAQTPARRRGGRAATSNPWERSLHTIAGPFGGVEGLGALISGPWGNGNAEAAGGAESDSSDDEMGQRSGAPGNLGVTPTAASGPAFPGMPGKAANLEGLGGVGAAAPNVGKIKSHKALADADPLGVDLNVDFTQVGGMQGHIDQLKEMVQLPLLYPELFSRFHVTPPRGVLFHGPPGTGKTLLARALSNSVGLGGRKISFYMRKGADALSKWVGEAEKQLRLLFEEARKTQPSIIFFDEIDGLAPVRSSKQEQIHASIVSTLLALMDGMDGRGQVIVIGATNRPDNIDPALRRPGRFDREFYFPLPDVDGRKAIIDIHTKDWGVSDPFKMSLARDTKGYGGADLRAMCTEAAMNAIQRTYPQIYSSKDKLIVDPSKISVHMTDFSISKKKIVPSSERSATSGAATLPKTIEPLLSDQMEGIKAAVDMVLPRKKNPTALEEAMFEPYDDADFGFGREALHDEFQRSRIFRPRLLICGQPGMGQTYISAAILHHFEGVHVQKFDLPTILGDDRTPEQTLVGLFTEVKRHKPSVIYIPNVDSWYATLSDAAMTAFLAMLRSIPPTDPVLLLATAEVGAKELDLGLRRDLFGLSSRNIIEIAPPSTEKRQEYFSAIMGHLRRMPKEFPDPANRKKRILEELPLAPPPPPKVLTKEERKAESVRYHQLLNVLKVHLQPIMDQINRKYKKFRNPVILQHQYQYLLDEADPNYVRPDVEGGQPRPFELETRRDGSKGLRATETGKFFHNLDISTIEERLAHGFYLSPAAFLRDVQALEHDAKAIGDKERFLKASELRTNVEVDVQDIAAKFGAINWEDEFQKQQDRVTQSGKKAQKDKTVDDVINLVQSDLEDSDAQPAGGLKDGKLHTTLATFQFIGDPSNGSNGQSSDQHTGTNGTSVPSRGADEDVDMTDAGPSNNDSSSAMPPPGATSGQNTQFSQMSAVQSLPPGVSPTAMRNDASTTKTSDPSTRSSNISTQATNGIRHEQFSPPDPMPDTQVLGDGSQATSGEDPWLHSQAQGLAHNSQQQGAASQSSHATASQATAKTNTHAPSMANLLNDPAPEEGQPTQKPEGWGSQPQVELDDVVAGSFLEDMARRTTGFTIEQLEQTNRELMAEVWATRGEYNRMKAFKMVSQVFNEALADIEAMQGFMQASQ